MIQELLSNVDSHLRIVFLTNCQDSGTIEGDVVRELSDYGIEQAEKCGDFLKQFSFNGLYTSDHLRAQQTIGIVDLPMGKEVTVTRKLREVFPFYAMGEIELHHENSLPVKEFLNQLTKNIAEGALVLAVSHCHLIRYIVSLRSIVDESLELRTVQDFKDNDLLDRDLSSVEIESSSITVVDISQSGLVTPRLVGYTGHL